METKTVNKKQAVPLVVAISVLVLAVPLSLRAEYRNEKTLRLDPGGRFALDSSVGSVNVTGTPEPGARIVITSNRDDLEELIDFRFEEGEREARVSARRRHSDGWPHHVWVHYEVRVPSDTRTQVKTGGGSVEISSLHGDADLNTSGGSIKVASLSASLRARTSGGSIHLQKINGDAEVDTSGGGIDGDGVSGRLEARTSGGSIRLERVGGDLLAHTSGGSIRIEDAGGRVDAKTSGGSVEVAFAQANVHGGQVETSGGGVTVRLDRSANLNVEASTSAGSVSTDLPIQVVGTISKSRLTGTLGSGGETLRLHSDGGPVRIEAR
jgi:putative adhesin